MSDHDYERFPELTNSQLETEQWASPHVQYTEDFVATVTKVTDGDTVQLATDERDFEFPLRLLDIDAPEMNQGGEEAKQWLADEIEGEEVMIIMNSSQRVGRYGRLLGKIVHNGVDMGEAMLGLGLVVPFGAKNEGLPLPLERQYQEGQWYGA